MIGRSFSEADDSPGAPQTVMLSHAYWQRRFAADPGVLGSTLRVEGTQREIVGILPPEFMLPRQEDGDPFVGFQSSTAIYLPFQWDPAENGRWTSRMNYQAIARLSPGASIEQARADVERMISIGVDRGGISPGVLKEIQLSPYLRPLKQDFVGDIGEVLWTLLGAVGIVLVIAWANVANLFLVRGEGRRQEVAVRAALGATRSQIGRRTFIESMLLGLLGGIAGLGVALGGVRLLISMGPESLPRLNEISLDPTVIAFTLATTLLSGLVFGLVTTVRLDGLNIVPQLKEGGRGGGAGKVRHRVTNALVVAQMALVLIVLAGSGLMIRSFQALRNVDPGFSNPGEVLTFRVTIPTAEVGNEAEVAVAYEEVWGRLEEMPGVTSVGASSQLTTDVAGSNYSELLVEDFPLPVGEFAPLRRFKYITEDYFEAMQIPVLAGRPIAWSDIHDGTPVAVVTENFARQYWGDPAGAIGRRIKSDNSRTAIWQEIIGVLGDVHADGLGRPAPPVIFWPMATNRLDAPRVQRAMTFAVRTTRPTASSLVPDARSAVAAVNPNLPLADVRTLDEVLTESMAPTSFTLVMLGIAAAVALALGVVGIYGVLSYTMSQRTREIGVRMALGADSRDVRRMVLHHGLILAVIGVGIGLLAAIGLTRLMSSLLYGVEATDPVTFVVVAAMLIAVALVASYLPALRASRTDPLEALRFE